VNIYAIEDGDGLVLIDAGWALTDSCERLESAVAGLGYGLGDIRTLLVTHIHQDHYTQAVALRREFGARISLGIGERASLDVLTGPPELQLAIRIRRLHACGARELSDRLEASTVSQAAHTMAWELPDDWLNGQHDIELHHRQLRVLPTPGHTQGHVCFLDSAAGLLFAGDHVLPHITPSIGLQPAPASLPLGDYLDSLRLVRGMPDTRLLPAHGPIGESVHARIDELLTHHGARLAVSAAAIEGGAATAYEAARKLTWTRRERPFDSLDPYNQMLSAIETSAHLDLLAMQGKLRTSSNDGITEYAISRRSPTGGNRRNKNAARAS
jgi:glyoxylase-like metal-dependent hydrolase (beta-lactamase superfamily II)